MTDTVERLQRALRAVAAGGDAGHMLEEALAGAVAATGGAGGVLVATVGAATKLLAATGAASGAGPSMEAAELALSNGRLTRRRFRSDAALAAAQPIRVDGRVVAAIAVAGPAAALDLAPLPLFADVVAIALTHVPGDGLLASTGPSAGDVLVTLAEVGTPVERDAVLVRALAGAERLFRATAGCCALNYDDRTVVAHQRGLDPDRLRASAADPGLAAALASTNLRVLPPAHATVASLGRPDDWAVLLPLVAGGQRLGHLLLFLADEPKRATHGLLAAFSANVATAVRSSTVHRQLTDHQERMATIVHSLNDPVIVIDDAGRFVSANGAAAELFGLANGFEVGRPVAERLDHGDLATMLSDPHDSRAEIAVGAPARPFSATLRRMISSDGRSLGRVLVLEDLSREREVTKVKSEFVAAVGRELRSPMMVVQGWASTLQRRWASLDDERRQGALDAIERNAGHLLHLIEDLLFVSGLEDHAPSLDLGAEDIGPLLEQCRGGRIAVERPDQPLVVALDRDSLEHVLSHLLDNALSCSDGPVLLEAAEVVGQVQVAVTDTGPGVYSGDLPRLFEGYGIDETGLRLYLCRRLVELMGGRIWCESRLGAGSRFVFSLPVQRQPVWGHGAAAAPADRLCPPGGASARP